MPTREEVDAEIAALKASIGVKLEIAALAADIHAKVSRHNNGVARDELASQLDFRDATNLGQALAAAHKNRQEQPSGITKSPWMGGGPVTLKPDLGTVLASGNQMAQRARTMDEALDRSEATGLGLGRTFAQVTDERRKADLAGPLATPRGFGPAK